MATKQVSDLSLLIGQLLEATKSANDAIKLLGSEVGASSTALAVVQSTIVTINKAVEALNQLVRDGGDDAVLSRLAGLTLKLDNVISRLTTLEEDAETLKDGVEEIKQDKQMILGGKTVLLVAGGVIGWLVSVGLSIYAILKGK